MLDKDLEKRLEGIDLSKEAPSVEPDRQYYFMKKMRGILADLEQKKGGKLTASAQTFGCQMNVDSGIYVEVKNGAFCQQLCVD